MTATERLQELGITDSVSQMARDIGLHRTNVMRQIVTPSKVFAAYLDERVRREAAERRVIELQGAVDVLMDRVRHRGFQ